MTLPSPERQDKLDMLLTLALGEYTEDELILFLECGDSPVSFSANYYRRKDTIIKRFKKRPDWAILRRILSSAAIVLLAIMSAAFLTIMSVSALRNAVVKIIIEWYDEYISVRHVYVPEESETEEETEGEILETIFSKGIESDSETTSVPTEILEYRKPTYLPDGVEEEEVSKKTSAYVVDYYRGDDLQYMFRQRLLSDKAKQFDGEGYQITYTSIKGKEAIVLQNEGTTEITIIWDDGEYAYRLISYLNMETTQALAESVG